MRRALSALLFFAVVAILAETVSWIGLSAIEYFMPSVEIIPRTTTVYADQTRKVQSLLSSQENGLVVLDADLGWRYREGYISSENQINLQGLRSSREYTRVPAAGIRRVAIFGDSFAYGSEVSNTESWPALIEDEFPSLEMLNYAVPGFGTDQAFLRYMREGQDLSPHLAILSFSTVNLRRAVNVYRRFSSTKELPLVKPRFAFDARGKLEVRPSSFQSASDYRRLLTEPHLVKELGRGDYWYTGAVYENWLYDWSATVRLATNIWILLNRKLLDPNRLLVGGLFEPRVFNVNSEAFRIQTALLLAFHNEAMKAGIEPLIVIFPGQEDIARARLGKRTSYDPLINYLEIHDLVYLDCADVFVGLGHNFDLERLFAPGGHYSAKGNRLVAHFIGAALEELDMSYSPRRRSPGKRD